MGLGFMNVLSLFDGMSCGQIALTQLGFKIDNYYASEIEPASITVAKHNFPNTIHIGDVTKVKGSELPKIDLLMGGSPCQGFSFAGKQLNFNDERSVLFFEFVRLLKETNPKYFLLENVKMKQESEDIISEYLGVKPIEINSNLVSAQNRIRLYWTNIPNITLPKDKGILLKDIIYDDNYKVFTDIRITNTKKKTKNYIKWDLSGKQYWSQQDRAYYKEGKICTLPKAQPSNKLNILLDYEKDIYRRLHPIEAERCQTVPDNYTDCVPTTKRLEMLGNGWTVEIIKHIFRNMNELS
jgi:DNA (cytosine-5)-methyltransferase 3A